MATISVIMPVYNGETYIKNALDSILAQSCKPDEIIVVNDGSRDRTAEIVERYDSIHNQENRGPPLQETRHLRLRREII